MLWIPHCVDNRLTEDAAGSQPYASAALYSQETFSGTHLFQRLSQPQSLVLPEELDKLKKKSIHFIGSRTRDFVFTLQRTSHTHG
jgi:hypothetical protein